MPQFTKVITISFKPNLLAPPAFASWFMSFSLVDYFGPWMMKKVAHQAITPGSVFYDVKKGENAQFMKASKVITAKEEFAPFFWK